MKFPPTCFLESFSSLTHRSYTWISSVFSTICWREYFLPHPPTELSWKPVENQFIIDVWFFFLDFQLYSIALCVYLYANTALFWLLQICRKFLNWEVQVFQLSPFSILFLLFLLWHFCINIRISFYILQK